MSTGRNSVTIVGALAWICTRDRSVVDRFEKQLAANIRTADDFEFLLENELERWTTTRRRPLRETIVSARSLLREALAHGIKSYGVEVGVMAGSRHVLIPGIAWLNARTARFEPYDRFATVENDGRIFEQVQISFEEIERVWPGVPGDFTLMCEDPFWSLQQVAYWVEHGSHEFFQDENINVPAIGNPAHKDDEPWGDGGRLAASKSDYCWSPENKQIVAMELRSGSLVGFRRSVSNEVASKVQIDPSEWFAIDPIRISNAVFSRDSVTARHAFRTTPPDRFTSRQSFIEHVKKSGITDAEAIEQARLAKLPDGRSRPSKMQR